MLKIAFHHCYSQEEGKLEAGRFFFSGSCQNADTDFSNHSAAACKVVQYDCKLLLLFFYFVASVLNGFICHHLFLFETVSSLNNPTMAVGSLWEFVKYRKCTTCCPGSKAFNISVSKSCKGQQKVIFFYLKQSIGYRLCARLY